VSASEARSVKRGPIVLCCVAGWLIASAAHAEEPATAGADVPPPPPPALRLHSEFEDAARLRIDVEYPPAGAVIRDSACGVFVAGRAGVRGEGHAFDVVIVIDTSRSTIEPALGDIDGDGEVGKAMLGPVGSNYEVRCTDPGDTILAAELAAARSLLRGLDPRDTRVALVTFAGVAPEEQHWFSRSKPARTVQPLSADFDRVERALDQVGSSEPEGSTHMAAGIDQATLELLGLTGARSDTNPRSEKVVFFFTDGQPTLPYGPARMADNVREVRLAASRAGEAGIRIHSFAIGREALEGPLASVEMAERTHGFFTPIRHPADLVDVVGEVSEVNFANLDEVSLRSLTTGAPAELFRTTADGAWAGFVRMQTGANQIEVSARASDGSQAVRRLEVAMAKEGASPDVPADLVLAHNVLLDECLKTVKSLRMEAERARAEQVRRQLRDEIEKERARARERASEQRKQLQLEVDEEPEPPSR
jgi:hypothetical protein